MPRIALDLNKAEDRQHVRGEWRVAPDLVPGKPNEGLTAQLLASPARLATDRINKAHFHAFLQVLSSSS